MSHENNRQVVLNKCKDTIDRLVSKARDMEAKYAKISLTTVADRLNLTKHTLYHYCFYDFFAREYLSVQYNKNSGNITVDVKKWVRERKEERYRQHLKKQEDQDNDK